MKISNKEKPYFDNNQSNIKLFLFVEASKTCMQPKRLLRRTKYHYKFISPYPPLKVETIVASGGVDETLMVEQQQQREPQQVWSLSVYYPLKIEAIEIEYLEKIQNLATVNP